MPETINMAKLAAMELRLETLQAASSGINATTDEARQVARDERHEALAQSPIPWSHTQPLAELEPLLAAEYEKKTAEPRPVAAHVAQVRRALIATRRALNAQQRVDALVAEHKRLVAELQPLQQLVKACRRYAGTEDDFLTTRNTQAAA